jgi:hypothetical protein
MSGELGLILEVDLFSLLTVQIIYFVVQMTFLFFFFVVLGLELRTYTLHLYLEIGSHGTICPGLASNHDPPDLCFLNR